MRTLKNTLAFWIPNGILLLCMVGSGIYYFVDSVEVAKVYATLQYPVYSMYFNAVAKFLGGIAIVAPVPRFLKEWAYAGYLYIMLLALQAQWMTMPRQSLWIMLVFIGIWAVAYRQFKKTAA